MERSLTETKNPLLNEVLADDSTEGHEKRLARYAAAKARQQEVSDYILHQNCDQVTGAMIENPDHAMLKVKDALNDCGSFLVYRHYYQLEKYRLLAGCTCKKHLLCALCAIRRAAKCVAVYSEKITEVTQGQEFDTVLITLTIKNGSDLAERYDHLQKSFQRLLQKRKNSLKKNPTQETPFKHVAGAIYSYEVTYSETGYHPHIHMIALVPKGIFAIREKILPEKEVDGKTLKEKTIRLLPDLWAGLVSDWQELTGDSKIVDVRLIYDEEDKMSALVETFKYALKMSEMDVSVQVACYSVLRTRRMIGSMGALFGVKLPVNLNDDLLPGEEKYIDLIYQYSGVNFGYQLISHGESSFQVSTLSQRFSKKKEPRRDALRTPENLLAGIREKANEGRRLAPIRYQKDYEAWLKKNVKKEPFLKTVDELEWI